jgi:hypothetical protein
MVALSFAMDHRQVGAAARLVAVGDQLELAVGGVQGALGNALDQAFVLAAVMDQVGDGADLQVVFFGELDQVRQARHGAVFLDDLADHRGRGQAAHFGQVAARFGMAGAHQDAALDRAQREDVARLHQVVRFCALVHGHLDGARAVGRRNTGGHALGRFDRDREIGAEGGAVTGGHHRQREAVADFFGQRQADQAARVADHEIDRLGRDEIGRQHQVAFVFAVFFVDQNDHAACAQFGNDFLGAGDRHADFLETVTRRA